ncbi:hypothetical protein Dda_2152 [Drechslerella dactyloides]|uniref:Choline kinase N-terminal domain-containing protein n=1 Tax=Drechslerella dactyloides TaxID=74499 RepID=A0AAD6J4S9_DREDA|nr:hypothetical protein Dda_2152 [Drechslerella dactyloides]
MTSIIPPAVAAAVASNKVEFSHSPSASPRTSPRIRPHRATIGGVLQAKIRHGHGRVTAESSPDIPGVDSAYGGSLADLDIGPSHDGLTMKQSRSSKSLASAPSANSFYEQVKSWYEEQLDHLPSGDPSGPPGPGLDSLKKLEAILESAALERPHFRRRSSKSLRNYRTVPSSGNLEDFYTTDNERTILQDVPSCEAELDNSRELSVEFRAEILRLTHTLKIKRWRKVSLDRGEELVVSRISGALTNAVYKVTPPHISKETAAQHVDTPHMGPIDGRERRPGRRPKPVLLRVYGPQVGHLIDRDTELNILRRLAKHKVGPTLLGTFDNGRFEEFYDAATLTRDDVRIPETSRRIGRRLRDLHDHIPLIGHERSDGPVLWKNWEKWVTRGEGVMKDLQKRRGDKLLVTSWEVLREVVEKRYRPWLEERHGGVDEIKRQLVFCHNDTQYGNIMSRDSITDPPTPASKSPALTPLYGSMTPIVPPRDESLIVIDFEYAGANTRGCEFANHFCEWMSDYHCLLSPGAHKIHDSQFPTLAEQRNMLRAYIQHRGFPYEDASEDPVARKRRSTPFLLHEEPTREEAEAMDREVERLVAESRDWRAAVNACWALWGIVQANVSEEGDEGVEDAEEFDYIKYAEQKAMVMWGDLVSLGVVKEEEVREWSGVQDVKGKLKWLPV